MGLLFIGAEPIFHMLFGNKWDDAIILFQILVLRGIFTVLTSLYNNYILAVGKSKILVYSELVKDIFTVAAILVTITYNVEIMVWGQLGAGIAYYMFMLYVTARVTGYSIKKLVSDVIPYFAIMLLFLIPGYFIPSCISNPYISLSTQIVSGLSLYYVANRVLHSKIQQDVVEYAFGRFRKK